MKGTRVSPVLLTLSLIGKVICLVKLFFFILIVSQDQRNPVPGEAMENQEFHSSKHGEKFPEKHFRHSDVSEGSGGGEILEACGAC